MKASDRISQAIRAAGDAGRPALVAYITAGFPSRERFRDDLANVSAAADVVEVGVPFTDPMADGLTIQEASRAALEAGVSLSWILAQIEAMDPVPRAPVVLMSYLNPLLAMGYDELAKRSSEAGVAGFIVPDLPLEESTDLDLALESQGIALIQLVTPVTPVERLERICRASRGFVYAVTVTGITGGDAGPGSGLGQYLERVKAAAEAPVCAGFGVRSPAQVEEIGQLVPGVVVGSALVEAMARGEDPADFLRRLSGASSKP